MKTMFSLAAVTLAALSLAGTALATEAVRISGATTVMNFAVNPAKAAVEKATGRTLAIVGSGTGKGLTDLVEGLNDIAMVSEPMEIAIDAAAIAGKQIDPKTIQFFELRKDEILFVVHPSNPVSKLSWDQLRDIHTGKITNWKEVGGKDLAISAYTGQRTDGTRAMVRKVVLGGVEYGPGVKPQTSIKRASELIGTDESGIVAVGKGFVDSSIHKVIDTRKIERPLALATLGAPKPAAKEVIDAFIREAKAK